MRLFIAFDLPESVVCAIADSAAQLRGHVHGRFTAADTYHVTIAFLGDVDEGLIDTIEGCIERGCAGATGFEVTLGALGHFGRKQQATLWQGFAGCEPLADIAHNVRAKLKTAGIAFDDKPFAPHVTIARKANLAGVDLAEIAPQGTASGTVDSITLYESRLSSAGAHYSAVASVRL